MHIQQLAARLEQAFDIKVNKFYENEYQRVFKHTGELNLTAAEQAGLITLFKDGVVVKEFSLDDIRFAAVASLNTITQAKSNF